MADVLLIWDYDTPVTRITTTNPYNCNFHQWLAEEDHVKYILKTAKQLDAKFTFAVVGFGAEISVAPFDVRHVIQQIHADGHEIASHSWKHEWLPHLSKFQLNKTVERSKWILEQCTGSTVNGFVLPHDRPMSWLSKLAFSAGDRSLYPFFPGADIDGVAKALRAHQYKWMRYNARLVTQKLTDWNGSKPELKRTKKFYQSNGFHFVPEHCMEFGQATIDSLNWAADNNKTLVIAGHPAALGFKQENLDNYNRFVELAIKLQRSGSIRFRTMSDYLNLPTHA
ncbi:MAG: hypothetical protein EOP51_00685 [Sphingobacteriales bacterium]|nr:MAG: hypothetical protein EOP51_00685 [Sphingobacteriales bacterium]